MPLLRQPAHGWPASAPVSVQEISRVPRLAARVRDTCHGNGTEVQHISCDSGHSTRVQDGTGSLRDGQCDVLRALARYIVTQTTSPADLATCLHALCAWRFAPSARTILSASRRPRGGNLRAGFENGLTAANGRQHKDIATSGATLID